MRGYWLYEWEDETSQFDPAGRWAPGSECYFRTYRMWVPNCIGKNNQERLDEYIERQSDAGKYGPWAGGKWEKAKQGKSEEEKG